MRATDTFRQQHKELLEIVNTISGYLSEDQIESRASDITQLLAKFSGKLKGHLAMEDRVLYPKLLSHEDAVINSMASRFMNEMGGIAEAVGEYGAKWSSAAAIQSDSRGFITETKRLFRALGTRIQSEDNVLYPTLDKIDG